MVRLCALRAAQGDNKSKVYLLRNYGDTAQRDLGRSPIRQASSPRDGRSTSEGYPQELVGVRHGAIAFLVSRRRRLWRARPPSRSSTT